MNKQEINWSKAPNWATGYGNSPGGHAWFSDDSYTYVDGRQEGRVFSIIRGEGWCLEEIRTVSSRPSPWSGTGLPPVGAACEGRSRKDKLGEVWGEVIVLAHRLGQAIVSFTDCERLQWCGEDDLRPIRTPEQIAAEEREKAIHEMAKIVGWVPANIDSFAKLYDAGYRKIDTSQPSPAEISSDIKQANLSLLAEKALAVYATRKEPVGSVAAVNLPELSDLRDLAVSLKDN